MSLSKQDQKYQAKQQLEAKFEPQCNNISGYGYFFPDRVDVRKLLKKVVR